MNIHIIGGGNLGVAIALGISKYTQHKLTVTRRQVDAISHLQAHGIEVSAHNTHNLDQADLIVLAIKPYQVQTVLDEIKPQLKNQIIASAVTGCSLADLRSMLTPQTPIVRIMPNIAIQFGESATCISYQPQDQKAVMSVVALFAQLGTAPIIEEKLMDAATVLGACGTAYALRYIRASMQAGIEIGFDSQTALAIAAQTAKGAARMLLEEKIHPEQLIDRVTTPQGCTIVGLNEMEHQGFSSSLIKGIKTSLNKIKE
jgi:pyrroline-5-carboxylate reductase